MVKYLVIKVLVERFCKTEKHRFVVAMVTKLDTHRQVPQILKIHDDQDKYCIMLVVTEFGQFRQKAHFLRMHLTFLYLDGFK